MEEGRRAWKFFSGRHGGWKHSVALVWILSMYWLGCYYISEFILFWIHDKVAPAQSSWHKICTMDLLWPMKCEWECHFWVEAFKNQCVPCHHPSLPLLCQPGSWRRCKAELSAPQHTCLPGMDVYHEREINLWCFKLWRLLLLQRNLAHPDCDTDLSSLGCVTLGWSRHLSEPWFLHPHNGSIMVPASQGYSENLRNSDCKGTKAWLIHWSHHYQHK